MSGWIFTIIGWLFSHTAATQLNSNHFSKWFLHDRSTLIDGLELCARVEIHFYLKKLLLGQYYDWNCNFMWVKIST